MHGDDWHRCVWGGGGQCIPGRRKLKIKGLKPPGSKVRELYKEGGVSLGRWEPEFCVSMDFIL